MSGRPPSNDRVAAPRIPDRVNGSGSFSQRLRRQPVLVEVIPPKIGSTEAQIGQALRHVGAVLDGTKAEAVNVPEILGSGFQSMDALDFGLHVRRAFGVDVVVNKVVVHEPPQAFRGWIDRVLASDVASAILVGGERGGIYYPGPRVTEANRTARERAEAAGRPDFPVGNVTIPSRGREALRMLDKIRAGADYFTSQIVYDFASANIHLQAYDDVCGLAGLEPRPVLYAFSPVASAQDILFLRYLGVNVPPDIERRLLAPDAAPPPPSIRIIQDMWSRLLDAAAARDVRAPLGVIVETVSRHNAEAAIEVARALRTRLEHATVPSAGGSASHA